MRYMLFLFQLKLRLTEDNTLYWIIQLAKGGESKAKAYVFVLN
jgi:hypothetical protein